MALSRDHLDPLFEPEPAELIHETSGDVGVAGGVFGAPLEIDIKPQTGSVTIEYTTSPDAAALQWLEPSQTAGKKHPFLLSQSQSILARTWVPIQDTPRVRELAMELRQDLHLLRVRWLEGRVHAGLGRIEESIKSLEEVRERFAGLEIAYDCALASVKLAALYLRQGRTPEVKALALWMEQVFRSLGIHREALEALLGGESGGRRSARRAVAAAGVRTPRRPGCRRRRSGAR